MFDKFDKLVKIILEDLNKNNYSFSDVKAVAVKEASRFVDRIEKIPMLKDTLNLDDAEDRKNFNNEIYKDIVKGSTRMNEGDVRELAYNLGIAKGLDWLSGLTSLDDETSMQILKDNNKMRTAKIWRKSNPNGTVNDLKNYLIRNNTSYLDETNKLYSLEFKELCKIYASSKNPLENAQVTIDKINGVNIVDFFYEHLKEAGYDFSKDFLKKLFSINNIPKNNANIGKGELMLCLLLKDAKWPPEHGDLQVGGKFYELKGANAKVGEVKAPKSFVDNENLHSNNII